MHYITVHKQVEYCVHLQSGAQTMIWDACQLLVSLWQSVMATSFQVVAQDSFFKLLLRVTGQGERNKS